MGHQRTGRGWILAALLLGCPIFLATAADAAPVTIYVSPAGNDHWSGTLPEPNASRSDGPFATLDHARDAVRQIRKKGDGPITVGLRGGTCFLKEPLVLTPEDSGTENSPIVWSAYQNEQVILSGGRRLTGWAKTRLNDRDVWVAKLPTDSQSPAMVHALWVNGRRLGRARWPHQGTLGVASLAEGTAASDWTKGVTEFHYHGDDLKAWPSAPNGEVIVATRWTESHLPIQSIDESNHLIHFAKRTVFRPDPNDRFWVENVREALTEPGEFYVDPKEHAVYLIPPTGIDPNDAEIIAPNLSQALVLAGDPAGGKFIEHVTFRGIAFCNTEWFFDRPSIGQSSAAKLANGEWKMKPDPTRSGFGQAAIGVPGSVEGVGVRSCVFDHCTFAHNGTYGIELGQGCQHNRISHCTLEDLGAGGVKIGEVAVRDAENQQAFANEVSDCVIADGGNLFPSCVAVWIGQSHDNVISHNDIHGLWYTAISMGWTWGYGKSAAQHNLVECNHIHHIGVKADGLQPILSDMGGIYTLGNQEGGMIRFNRFHDIAGLRYGGWGIYFDEGTTHLTAEKNVVYRTTHGGFHQHYGKENTFRDNVIAFGRDNQIQRTRVEDHLSFTFENNIVLWDQGVLLTGNWQKMNCRFNHNTYWYMGSGEIRFANKSWQQWQQAGMDKDSKIANPHFENAIVGDFRLTEESQQALAGFEPFDLSTVGPR